MSSRRSDDGLARRWTVRVLVLTAVVLALLAFALSYLDRAVLQPGPFADRAVAALRDPAVQADAADRLTTVLTNSAGGGDLLAVRPLVRSLAGAVVSSDAFVALFRRAVIAAHRAVVERRGVRIVVAVADVGVLVQGVLERFAPDVARRIGAERVAQIINARPGGGALDAVRTVKRVASLRWLLGVLALLAAAVAVVLSSARQRTVQRLALGVMVDGFLVVAMLVLGRRVAEQAAAAGRGPAVGALWNAFLGGLRVQALWLAIAGAGCAAAASAQFGPSGRKSGIAQLSSVISGAGTGSRVRLSVAVALGAGGLLILLEPSDALSLAVQLSGLYVLYRAIVMLIGAIRSARSDKAARKSSRIRPDRLAVPAAVGVLAVGGIGAMLITGAGDEAPAATPLTCNGFAALCDRPLNDVALAATHNSMASVTIPRWLFGQQDGTIKNQLDQGIRGLLIDSYHGFAVPRGVRTDLTRLPKLAALEQEVGPGAAQAALRLRSRVGYSGEGKPGIFLCHGFCELGAVSLASVLTDLRSFLVTHPAEVIVIVNQDEGVSPSDMEQAFSAAGLLDLVYRGPLGPFPTLRKMIESGQRLVVMAENDAGQIPWYHLAFQHALRETPFRFKRAADLTDPAQVPASCRPGRGPSSAPLFLLNNWIDTTPAPRASLAAKVNSRSALLTRAETCDRIRGHLANLVAVDFYRRGDLIATVDALNRVSR